MTLILFGASGKMGQVTAEYIKKNFKQEQLLQVTFNKKKSEQSKTLIFFKNLKLTTQTSKAVVIDFSNKKCLSTVILFCKKNKIPLVSAVTGYDDKDFLKLKKASLEIPVLWSANFSEGVSAIKKLLADARLKKFKFSIIEAHHKHKKDKPSGTAKSFKNIIQKNTNSSVSVSSIRTGEIFGSHHIVAIADNEVLKIDHFSQSREIFSEGATHAAFWIINKKPAFYNFEDVS
jgi:4-hydroxy-tetrahydrodipicolinate reductase